MFINIYKIYNIIINIKSKIYSIAFFIYIFFIKIIYLYIMFINIYNIIINIKKYYIDQV